MTVRVNPDNTRTIYGLSTDTKPTTTVDGIIDIEQGDSFYCIDNAKIYMWSGQAWVEQE